MKFLLDEMFPPEAAELLGDRHGHDAVHVSEVGLGATDDREDADAARDLPGGGAQASALAELLDRWAAGRPAPYLGPHWPA